MKTIALLATLLFALPAGADHHKEDPALPDLADAQKLKKDGFAPLFNVRMDSFLDMVEPSGFTIFFSYP